VAFEESTLAWRGRMKKREAVNFMLNTGSPWAGSVSSYLGCIIIRSLATHGEGGREPCSSLEA